MIDAEGAKFARDRVASYEEQIRMQRAALKRIDVGMRFYEARGDEEMRDVTDQRRADIGTHIAVLEDARAMWTREAERFEGRSSN